MVNACCVKGCKSVWNPNSPVTFHSFPLKREELLNEWIRVVPAKTKVSKYSRICSEHFTKSSFSLIGGRTYLKKDSIPTIFEYDLLQDHGNIVSPVPKLLNTGKRKASPIIQDAHPDIQQLNEHSYPEASIECETAATPVPELSGHHEEVIQQSKEDRSHVSELSIYYEEVIQELREFSYPEEASIEYETVATHVPELFGHHEEVIQQSKEDSYPEEVSIECETAASHVPELCVRYEETVQRSQKNGHPTNFECETTKTHVPELSPYNEEVARNKDVAVQTSPRRFAPSDEEIKLRKKIKLLQKQLGRRKKKISNVQ